MKKLLFIAVLVLLFLAGCSNDEAGYFRDSEWGMSMDQVKDTENLEPRTTEVEGALFYDEKLDGYKADIMYFFDEKNGDLVNGSYTMMDIIEKKEVMTAKDKITKTLKDKYGDVYVKTKTELDGNVSLWKTNKSFIVVTLGSADGISYLLDVNYYDKESYKDTPYIKEILKGAEPKKTSTNIKDDL